MSRTKNRLIRWFVRIAIPIAVVSVHMAFGISFSKALLLLFVYSAAVASIAASPFMFTWPLAFVARRVLQLYGVQESYPDGKSVGFVVRCLGLGILVPFFLIAIFMLAQLPFSFQQIWGIACMLFMLAGTILILTVDLVRPPRAQTVGAPNGEDDDFPDISNLVGCRGFTTTPMRPCGKVALNGVKYDAMSEHEFLDRDTPIQVISAKDGTLRVRALPYGA